MASGGVPDRLRASRRPRRSPGRRLPRSSRRSRPSLVDASDAVRLAAVSAVRSTDDRAALPTLRERFQIEKEPKVRQEVALALGSMGDKDSLPLLIAALRDLTNPEGVRSAALTGLESIGGKPAIEALVETLSKSQADLKPETQARMVAALGRFKAKEAIPAIADRLSQPVPRSGSPRPRRSARSAMRRPEPPRFVPP